MLDRRELVAKLAERPYDILEGDGDNAMIAKHKKLKARRRIDLSNKDGRDRASRLDRGVSNSQVVSEAVDGALLRMRIQAHRPPPDPDFIA